VRAVLKVCEGAKGSILKLKNPNITVRVFVIQVSIAIVTHKALLTTLIFSTTGQ
jgi:hypothetical protein